MYTIRGTLKSQYEIVATRLSDHELDIDVKSEEFGTEKGTIILKEDTLILSARKSEGRSRQIHLERISTADAKTRISNIAKMKVKQ